MFSDRLQVSDPYESLFDPAWYDRSPYRPVQNSACGESPAAIAVWTEMCTGFPHRFAQVHVSDW